jgi:hypothetical protein
LPQDLARIWDMKLSADASLLAYVSEESDRPEVYVTSLPGCTNKVMASRGGGRQVQWNPAGAELLYLSLDGRSMMSVAVKREGGLEVGAPTRLFDLSELMVSGDFARNPFDVSPDGQRFLMVQNVKDTTPGALPGAAGVPTALLVLNWFEEFREKP